MRKQGKEIVWVFVGYGRDGLDSTTKILSHCKMDYNHLWGDFGCPYKGRVQWDRIVSNKRIHTIYDKSENKWERRSILMKDTVFFSPAETIEEFKMYHMELFL